MARKWSGPVLAGLGVAAIALLAAASESPLARWTLTDTLAPERVLPLIGLGVAFGLVGVRVYSAALLLLGLGIIAGFTAEDRLLRILDAIPQAATHLFLTGPISFLAAGVALVSGGWLAPFAALVVGAMLALIIKLTDPSLHDPAYTWTPILIAFWIAVAVSMTLRAYRHRWFLIFGRILGSWLLAIGLLYGGASLVPKRQPPPPPSMALPPVLAPAPGADRAIPGLPVPDQPSPLPRGVDRFRQP